MELHPDIGKWLEMLQRLPGSPTHLSPEWDPGKVPCVCGKFRTIAGCRVAFSGYVNYVVALCDDCGKDLHDYARVVCPRCHMMVLLLKPGTDRNGFEVKKGAVYHVDRCRWCAPEVNCAAILEKKLWLEQRQIPHE